MIRVERGTEFTAKLVSQILLKHKPEELRRTRLRDYFEGRHLIQGRKMDDPLKPNNKVVHPYGNYITKTVIGYFLGEPVSYAATSEEYEDLVKALQRDFEYNDEQKENINLGKDASIMGVAYELLYIDQEKNLRFRKIDPEFSAPVFTTSLTEELYGFIRYYTNVDDTITVEVYTETEILTFTGQIETLTLINRENHPFGQVPVAIYRNNEEELGDYELVLTLIDAVDKLMSDSVNDFEAFADAYLILEGLLGTEAEDVVSMRENRVLLLPEGSEARWLIKEINDTYFQNVLSKLESSIHKFTSVPDMLDKNFGSDLSGIAIKYKLLNLENITSVKEAYFKDGLQRRIELMTSFLNLFGSEYSYLGVDIMFRRNLPVNELERVEMVNRLMGIVSDETAISQLPFVNDPAAELEKRDNQLSFDFGLIDEQETDTQEDT